MAGFRDSLIHAYDRVDIGEIWNIVEQHVPQLLLGLEGIRSTIET
jgi:uncharacterized protein with HEPN domain